jgi:sRNA-binding protein
MKSRTIKSAISAVAFIGFLGLVFTTTAAEAAAVKAKAKKAKKTQQAAGTVTAVDEASIAIETKKQGNRKFELTRQTVYKSLDMKDVEVKPATLADVHVGEQVKVVATGATADQIVITMKKHKSKKT